MKPLQEIARRYGLTIIEDAAQGLVDELKLKLNRG